MGYFWEVKNKLKALLDKVFSKFLWNFRPFCLLTPIYSPIDTEISLKVDKMKFKQALKNIIDNAYKYSPNGGDVLINVTHDTAQHVVEIEVKDLV